MSERTQRKPPRHDPEEVVTVLTVGVDDQDRQELRRIFQSSNWVMYETKSCQEAVQFLKANPLGVVLCESSLTEGCWKNLLNAIESMRRRPLLVVTSSKADDSLWSEVLNLGGYDVLAQPYDKSEVVRILSLAWLHWKTTGEQTPQQRAAYAS
jgi:DNA-binding NtrC family response regulator